MKKKSKQLWYNILTGILLILFVILVVYSGYLIFFFDGTTNGYSQALVNIDEENDLVVACDNKDLSKTAYCMQTQVSQFFVYNMSNANKTLTFNELKIEGGVCRHWAKLYQDVATELKYESKLVYFKIGDTPHVNLIIADKTGYCLMEQNSLPACYQTSEE